MTDPTTPSAAGGWHNKPARDPVAAAFEARVDFWRQEAALQKSNAEKARAESVHFEKCAASALREHAAAIEAARREGWCAGRDAAAVKCAKQSAYWVRDEIYDGLADDCRAEGARHCETAIRTLNPPETAP